MASSGRTPAPSPAGPDRSHAAGEFPPIVLARRPPPGATFETMSLAEAGLAGSARRPSRSAATPPTPRPSIAMPVARPELPIVERLPIAIVSPGEDEAADEPTPSPSAEFQKLALAWLGLPRETQLAILKLAEAKR